eukprot:gb/GFBE01049116.1/.p1 GENE.gb/GFBE01049116.1/~~gb/GFBE01049116.1/.p1  ORF type:complete len:402 (+),score=57.60 gb/GFBE01049116.1/:1-1206(+)
MTLSESFANHASRLAGDCQDQPNVPALTNTGAELRKVRRLLHRPIVCLCVVALRAQSLRSKDSALDRILKVCAVQSPSGLARPQALDVGCPELIADPASTKSRGRRQLASRFPSQAKSPQAGRRRSVAAVAWSSLAAAVAGAVAIATPQRARAAGRKSSKLALVHSVGGREVLVPGSRSDTAVAHALDKVKYPVRWPYTARDFSRLDRSDDSSFYDEPKLVKHIDDKALAALTAYYAAMFPEDSSFAALDICSSWVSHYPERPRPSRLSITGMNAEELKRNVQATDWAVQDLNLNPKLPYADAQFDIVTNTVSADYLTRPLEVFQEIGRVLRPGGLATVAFSNRCFLTKVVALWSTGDDEDRAEVAANYFHFAGCFRDAEVVDISPSADSDPLYVVSAVRI